MKVDVHIKELKKLIGVQAHDIKSSNEILTDEGIKGECNGRIADYNQCQ